MINHVSSPNQSVQEGVVTEPMKLREEAVLQHARAVMAQGALIELIEAKTTDPDIFLVATDPRYTNMHKLDCVAFPPDESPNAAPELKESKLIISVDANDRAWNGIVAILKSLETDGVTPRKATAVETPDQDKFPAQAEKFSFRGYRIFFSNTEFV